MPLCPCRATTGQPAVDIVSGLDRSPSLIAPTGRARRQWEERKTLASNTYFPTDHRRFDSNRLGLAHRLQTNECESGAIATRAFPRASRLFFLTSAPAPIQLQPTDCRELVPAFTPAPLATLSLCHETFAGSIAIPSSFSANVSHRHRQFATYRHASFRESARRQRSTSHRRNRCQRTRPSSHQWLSVAGQRRACLLG